MPKFKIGDTVKCIKVENIDYLDDFPGAGWVKDREFKIDSIWSEDDEQGACYGSNNFSNGIREGALELVITHYEIY